ncbi:MAG: DUF2927 domain-containing protein [Qingshengfaniella sp.]
MGPFARVAGVFGVFAMAGCTPLAMVPPATSPAATPTGPALPLPPMHRFGPTDPQPPMRSNEDIARDIIDLTFYLESGAELPVLTRFDTPVTLTLTGRHSTIFDLELDRLIARLRSEARIPITRLANDAPDAAITVTGITRHEMQRIVPAAACFVLPARISWSEFSTNPRQKGLDWTQLRRRDYASIFIPADASPQEIRDCLHEEIAQALGPLNDLYRLEDSVFNDDNMQSILTGFDMLVLRTLYDPALENGMTKAQVAAALPGILARLNPGGARYASHPYQPSPREWAQAIERALTPNRFPATRRRAARQALDIARAEGWTGNRLGLSLLTTGRLARSTDTELALSAFLGAADVYGARDTTQVQAATVAVQIAAFALAAGQNDAVLRIATHFTPIARRAENAALLTDFLLLRATALDSMGDPQAAGQARLDAMGWGRYALRSEEELRARMAEIATLPPPPAPAPKGQT